jgi:hypothetical protein
MGRRVDSEESGCGLRQRVNFVASSGGGPSGILVGCPADDDAIRSQNIEAMSYFLAAVDLAAASAYFFWKRSTRPAVSTSFCLPVKKGWQLEQISTRSISPLMVERVWKVWPQAQCTVTA